MIFLKRCLCFVEIAGLAILSFPLYSQPPGIKLPVVKSPVFKKDTFSIRNYGARPDGLTLNTNSIIAAIEACSRNGGGVVLVPMAYG